MASFGLDVQAISAAMPAERNAIESAKAAAIQTTQVMMPGSIQWKNRARMLAGQVRNKGNNLATALENAANADSVSQSRATQEVINWLMALSRTINQI